MMIIIQYSDNTDFIETHSSFLSGVVVYLLKDKSNSYDCRFG